MFQPPYHITGLRWHPIVSCRGIPDNDIRVGPRGIEGDREFVIVDTRNGLVLTQYDEPTLCQLYPIVGKGKILVQIPRQAVLSIPFPGAQKGFQRQFTMQGKTETGIDQGDDIARALSNFLNRRVRLVRHDPHGTPQLHPLLGIGTADLEDLNKRLSYAHSGTVFTSMTQFRPNFVWEGLRAYEADRWDLIEIGGVQFQGEDLCEQPATVNIDQASGKVHPREEPLRTLATYRRLQQLNGGDLRPPVFGRMFRNLEEGMIRVGQRITVPQAKPGSGVYYHSKLSTH